MQRRFMVMVLILMATFVLGACGNSDLGQLLTVVRVEEELADGTRRPVSGAAGHQTGLREGITWRM